MKPVAREDVLDIRKRRWVGHRRAGPDHFRCVSDDIRDRKCEGISTNRSQEASPFYTGQVLAHRIQFSHIRATFQKKTGRCHLVFESEIATRGNQQARCATTEEKQSATGVWLPGNLDDPTGCENAARIR